MKLILSTVILKSFFCFVTLHCLLQFINITATFVWSFCDLFVIIISVGLATRFKQINDSMLMNKGKVGALIKFFNIFYNQLKTRFFFFQFMMPDYWAENREYYRDMCELVSQVDKKIAYITMISISNNLFFICVQLLNSLE